MATQEKTNEILWEEAKKRYVTGIPRKPLEKGRVLVHNHVTPYSAIGINGFRAWTQMFSDRLLVECECDWAGVDLRGLKHFRVRACLPGKAA